MLYDFNNLTIFSDKDEGGYFDRLCPLDYEENGNNQLLNELIINENLINAAHLINTTVQNLPIEISNLEETEPQLINKIIYTNEYSKILESENNIRPIYILSEEEEEANE